MPTTDCRPSLREIGYRRHILVLGAIWGAAPGLSYLAGPSAALSPTQALVGIGVVTTISLGFVYELDNRALAAHGRGVPLAWSYALLAPLSLIAWALFGAGISQISPLSLLGILAGPPVSVLVYLWQRGRHAAVS
jgi:hypothetical protein